MVASARWSDGNNILKMAAKLPTGTNTEESAGVQRVGPSLSLINNKDLDLKQIRCHI